MSRPDDFFIPQRLADYEECEERLTLAAHSLAEPLLEPLAAASPLAQEGVSAPAHPAARSWDADLAYIRQTYGLQGAGQTVAIIDSGVAYDHLALGGGLGSGFRVVGGRDFTAEDDADPYDDPPAGFHGTLVAGVIGSSDATYPGVAPAVDFVALRVFDDQGRGDFAAVEQALQWLHTHRASFRYPITTVNLSLGANLAAGDQTPRDLLEDDFAQLRADGLFVAVAAGNAFDAPGANGLSYPASSAQVVPVASLQADGSFSAFSQRDPRVLAALGEHVTSAVPSHLFGGGLSNDFAYAHGTSLATPYVAGAGVLVREAMERIGLRDVTPAAIEMQLRNTADPFLDPQTQQTYLRLNLRRAIDELYAPAAPRPATATTAITRHDGGVDVWGTAADDTFVYECEPACRVLLNGVASALSDSERASIAFHGQGGADTLQIVTSSQDDIAHVWSAPLRVQLDQSELSADGVGRLVVVSGGGFDKVYLEDSPGDDTLRMRPDSVVLAGAGVETRVARFARVYAQSRQGGNDVAYLYDSAGGDRFYAYPSYAVLSGHGFFLQAAGFDRVYAFAESGGADQATWYDSAGNDRFYARAESATMSGQGFFNQASGFGRLTALASVGDDQAQLYDTAGDDHFAAYPTSATVSASSRTVAVRGFDRVSAYAQAGGMDRATFYGSSGNDRFVAYPTYASMSGLGYLNYARGFSQVRAVAGAGNDTAVLHGSVRNETLTVARTQVQLSGASFLVTAERFPLLDAHGDGGVDAAVFQEVGRGDLFFGRGPCARLAAADHVDSAYDFDAVRLLGIPADADVAALDYLFDQLGEPSAV